MITKDWSIGERRFNLFFAIFAIAVWTIMIMVCLQGCASTGTSSTGSKTLAVIDEGIQKIQYLKPVVDGIFTSLCAAGGASGGVIGTGACAAYPLISAGVSGVLSLADSAIKASQDPSALNQQQMTNQASSVAQTAAVLAELYQHPEKAEELLPTMPTAAAATSTKTVTAAQ